MVNRVRYLFDEDVREYDYFEIETLMQTYIVTQATALNVERALRHVPEPVWIEFHDLFGTRHRVVAWQVQRIVETTPARLEAWRNLQRARSREYE